MLWKITFVLVRYSLLSILETKMLGFDHKKGLCAYDDDFSRFFELCEKIAHVTSWKLLPGVYGNDVF